MPVKLRYEIYLPLFYNNRKLIENSKFKKVKTKLQKKFGSLSIHPANIEGIWLNPKTKKLFLDNCFKYEIIVDKTKTNVIFFEKYKLELKSLFKQKEILILSTELTII